MENIQTFLDLNLFLLWYNAYMPVLYHVMKITTFQIPGHRICYLKL